MRRVSEARLLVLLRHAYLSPCTNRYSMSTAIPWDKSRMEWKPIDMTVTYNGDGRFTASTPAGLAFPMEPVPGQGGTGKVPNPIQYLIGSLGGCVGVKILLALSDRGIVPQEMTIAIHGTRKKAMPAFFDHVHLTVSLRADVDDALAGTIIDQTLTRLCPIAAMFAEVGNVTAEHRIIRTR